MSCDDCEHENQRVYDESPPQCWVRVGNANVRVIGCQKHLKMTIDLLRAGRGQVDEG